MHLGEPSCHSCSHYFKLVWNNWFFFASNRLIIIVIKTIDWFVAAILFSDNATTCHVILTI